MNIAYGIDFGTTNSVLARASASDVETIVLDDQAPAEWTNTGFDKVLPSVIAFDQAKKDARGEFVPLFGWLAKQQVPANKLEAVKRLFATDDEVMIGGRQLKVEAAAATFFRHIQQQAVASGLVDRMDRAVVTVPANSRGKARYRTKLCAGLAGIEVSALINEPTAAAMAHARMIGQNQRILVFDWGGGTLDVTVMEAYQGVFIEQSSKGIQRLGGIDIDKMLLDALMPRLPGVDAWMPHETSKFKLDLELAKIQLSSNQVALLQLPRGGTIELTRSQFEETIMPLIERTREPVEVCLRDSPGRIDHLVMVGGSSKMPVIQRFIADIVGSAPNTDVDPMTAIAEGAAIADAILQGIITDLDFHVGAEHALGTVVHNTGPAEGIFSVLIPRNTKYPARATDSYRPANDFQEEVNIKVIEGDPDKPITDEDDVILKDWTVTLPEKRLVIDAGFDMTYDYDVDGILHVTARDERTGLIFMDEELTFGAAQDRSALPAIRKVVDQLMSGTVGQHELDAGSAPVLSLESVSAIRKARDKVLPFVTNDDRQRLEPLVAALERAAPEDEEEHRAALERELRVHAYLLV